MAGVCVFRQLARAVVIALPVLLTPQGRAATHEIADAVMRENSAGRHALIHTAADVNAPQADATTALHWAVYRGDVQAAAALLSAGVDPNVRTGTGLTPLALACEGGNAELGLLLKAKADVNETLANGETPLLMPARTGLMVAAHKGRNDVIELLVQHGANLETHDMGSRDGIHTLAGVSWQAIDYADGLVRVGGAIRDRPSAELRPTAPAYAGGRAAGAGRRMHARLDLCDRSV
jgi:hypothetical protein